MRELLGRKADIANLLQRHEQEIRDVKNGVEWLQSASDSQRESQEREAKAVADVQKVVGQLAGDLANLRSENGHHRSGVGEVARANDQLRAEAARLKQRIEALEQDNRRLSETNGVAKRDIGQVSDCCPKVKKDLTDLQQELARLKEEMRATRPKAEPLAPPTANSAVPPAPHHRHPPNLRQ
jgi:chromosome segregation ATPase